MRPHLHINAGRERCPLKCARHSLVTSPPILIPDKNNQLWCIYHRIGTITILRVKTISARDSLTAYVCAQGVVSCNLYWLHARHFQQLCNSRLNCDLYRHGTVTSQPFPCLTDCESGHMHGTGINITKYFEVDKFLSCRKLLWKYNIAQMWTFPHDIFAMLSLWYLYLRYDKYALLMSHRIMLHCRELFVRRIFLCTTLPFLLTALNQNGLFSMYYMFICFSYFVQTLVIYFDSRRCVFKLGSSLCMLCNCISW